MLAMLKEKFEDESLLKKKQAELLLKEMRENPEASGIVQKYRELNQWLIVPRNIVYY